LVRYNLLIILLLGIHGYSFFLTIFFNIDIYFFKTNLLSILEQALNKPLTDATD
jgi:hypothetical protein